jgi:MerR family redox-sensitive transcriptional activator SoxR
LQVLACQASEGGIVRIGELAARSEVSVRALRYYEEQDLLHSARNSGGQRQYPDAAVERVKLIQQFYAAGLTSKTVREMLPCMNSGEVTPALLRVLAVERDRIDQRIEDLVSARHRLDDLIASAEEPNPDCTHVRS